MKSRTGTLAVLALALACPSAVAAPATVNLRVEGETETIFEGRVKTDAKTIEQDRNGPQKCDGTNGGANATPGPTLSTALDDAIAWDGTYDPSFSDFLVNRIGPDAGSTTKNKFWGNALNGVPAEAGGCQVQVKDGDDVLWAYDLFSAKQFLELSGPRTVRLGMGFKVKVTDAKANDKPVKGARVAGVKTDSKGVAALKGSKRGVVVLKAERRGALRSNALVVRVR